MTTALNYLSDSARADLRGGEIISGREKSEPVVKGKANSRVLMDTSSNSSIIHLDQST